MIPVHCSQNYAFEKTPSESKILTLQSEGFESIHLCSFELHSSSSCSVLFKGTDHPQIALKLLRIVSSQRLWRGWEVWCVRSFACTLRPLPLLLLTFETGEVDKVNEHKKNLKCSRGLKSRKDDEERDCGQDWKAGFHWDVFLMSRPPFYCLFFFIWSCTEKAASWLSHIPVFYHSQWCTSL